MARRGQRQSGARRTAPRTQRRVRDLDNDGIIPVLARAVREVETAVERGRVMPSVRTKFQVVALLVREERNRIKADTESTEAHRGEQLKRLDGVATILAKTAARDTSLLQLLAEDAEVSEAGRTLKREMLLAAGVDAPVETAARGGRRPDAPPSAASYPQSVVSRQLANPFLAPDFSAAPSRPASAAPAGQLGAARPAVPLVRVRRRRGVVLHVAARAGRRVQAPERPRADAAPGPAGRGRGGRAPHLPARRRAGARQDRAGAARRARRPTPTRCWSSSRTSSRPTGPVRPTSGRRSARRP